MYSILQHHRIQIVAYINRLKSTPHSKGGVPSGDLIVRSDEYRFRCNVMMNDRWLVHSHSSVHRATLPPQNTRNGGGAEQDFLLKLNFGEKSSL
jgi:hypothetical protein